MVKCKNKTLVQNPASKQRFSCSAHSKMSVLQSGYLSIVESADVFTSVLQIDRSLTTLTISQNCIAVFGVSPRSCVLFGFI